jgi:hypothetical protein
MEASTYLVKRHIQNCGENRVRKKNIFAPAKLSTYGLSAEQIADDKTRDVRTIEEWLSGIAEKSERFHKSICLIVGLMLQFLQMDELWSYLQNKNRQMWVFVALDPMSKFWVNFEERFSHKSYSK